MDAGDKAVHVTQGEFYSALTLIWTFIVLAFSTTAFTGSPSTSHPIVNVIYLAASLLMVVNYTARALGRGGASRKSIVVAVVMAAVALGVGVVAFFANRQ